MSYLRCASMHSGGFPEGGFPSWKHEPQPASAERGAGGKLWKNQPRPGAALLPVRNLLGGPGETPCAPPVLPCLKVQERSWRQAGPASGLHPSLEGLVVTWGRTAADLCCLFEVPAGCERGESTLREEKTAVPPSLQESCSGKAGDFGLMIENWCQASLPRWPGPQR